MYVCIKKKMTMEFSIALLHIHVFLIDENYDVEIIESWTRQRAESGSVDIAPEIDLSRSRASRRGASPSNLVASIRSRAQLASFADDSWVLASWGTDRFNRENRMVHEGTLLRERKNDRPARSGPSFNWKLYKTDVYMTIEPADV